MTVKSDMEMYFFRFIDAERVKSVNGDISINREIALDKPHTIHIFCAFFFTLCTVHAKPSLLGGVGGWGVTTAKTRRCVILRTLG